MPPVTGQKAEEQLRAAWAGGLPDLPACYPQPESMSRSPAEPEPACAPAPSSSAGHSRQCPSVTCSGVTRLLSFFSSLPSLLVALKVERQQWRLTLASQL